MSNYIYYFNEVIDEFTMLQNIYTLLFIWFIAWSISKIISWLTNASNKVRGR